MLKLMTCKRISNEPALYDAFVHDGGKIDVSPAGGGPVAATFWSQAAFLKEFVKAEPDLTILKKGTVTAEFLPGLEFPCFTNGQRWNGWGMPRFDESTANRLVEMFTAAATDGNPSSLRWHDGTLEEYDWSDLKYYPCAFRDEAIDGAVVRLWGIGDGWCWNAVDFPNQSQSA